MCTVDRPGDYTVTGRVSGTAVAAAATLRVVADAAPVGDGSRPGPDWVLLLGGGLLLATAARSVLGKIIRRRGALHEQHAPPTGPEHDGDWVRHNVRTVPYAGPITSATRPRSRRPDFVLRLTAHADADGTKTAEES